MSVFVDTNVLVYARDSDHPAKQERAQAWLEHLWSSAEGRISAQVLNEYYVTVTRRLEARLSPVEARADIEDLLAWSPQPIDTDLVLLALEIGEAAQLSHWDALIVAAAQRSGCTHLLTEDLNDGQQIDTVAVINPVRARAAYSLSCTSERIARTVPFASAAACSTHPARLAPTL